MDAYSISVFFVQTEQELAVRKLRTQMETYVVSHYLLRATFGLF